MRRKYKISDQDKLYFVTFSHKLARHIRRAYRDIFLDSLRFCRKNKGLEVCAYVVMSSHVHMTIGRNSDPSRDIKKYTVTAIINAIKQNPQESRRELLVWLFERAGKRYRHNTKYQFWQQHNHPIELNTNEMIQQRLDYIQNNPVEAGIVLSPEDYLYSSPLNYAGLPEKLMEVILI